MRGAARTIAARYSLLARISAQHLQGGASDGVLWTSGLAVPIVQARSPPRDDVEAAFAVDAALRHVLAGVGGFANLGLLHGAAGKVLERPVGGVDDLVRVLGTCRNEDHVAGFDGKHLAGDPD